MTSFENFALEGNYKKTSERISLQTKIKKFICYKKNFISEKH